MCSKIWCSAFGKGTQPFDLIKCNKLKKLADEVKYISQASTMQQWIHGIKINKSNKSKVKNSAN